MKNVIQPILLLLAILFTMSSCSHHAIKCPKFSSVKVDKRNIRSAVFNKQIKPKKREASIVFAERTNKKNCPVY